MLFTTIWIEGEKALNDFCKRRFKALPIFIETIGRVGPAKIYKVYKWREDKQCYTPMYLLFMKHENGTVGDIEDIRQQTYEQIRANRNSILVP